MASSGVPKPRAKRHSIDDRLEALPNGRKTNILDLNHSSLQALNGTDEQEDEEELAAMLAQGGDDTPSPRQQFGSPDSYHNAASRIEEEYDDQEEYYDEDLVPAAPVGGHASKKLSFSSAISRVHHRASVASGFSVPSRSARSSLGTNLNRLNVSDPSSPQPPPGCKHMTPSNNGLRPARGRPSLLSTGGRSDASAGRNRIRRLTLGLTNMNKHITNTFPSIPPSPAAIAPAPPAAGAPAAQASALAAAPARLNNPQVASSSPSSGKVRSLGAEGPNVVPSSDEEDEDEPELPPPRHKPKPRAAAARPAARRPNVDASSSDEDGGDDDFEIPDLGPNIDQRLADAAPAPAPADPAPAPAPPAEEEDDSKRAAVEEDEPEPPEDESEPPEPMDMDDGLMDDPASDPEPAPAPAPRPKKKKPAKKKPNRQAGQRRPRKRRKKVDGYDVDIYEYGTQLLEQEKQEGERQGPRRSKRATKGMKPLEYWRGERYAMVRNEGDPCAHVDLTQGDDGNLVPTIESGWGTTEDSRKKMAELAQKARIKMERDKHLKDKQRKQAQRDKKRGRVKRPPKEQSSGAEVTRLRKQLKQMEKTLKAEKKKTEKLTKAKSQLEKKGEKHWLRKLKKSLPAMKIWQLDDPHNEKVSRALTGDGEIWIATVDDPDGERKELVAKTRAMCPGKVMDYPEDIPASERPPKDRAMRAGKALEQQDFSSGFLTLPPQGKKFKEAPQMTEVFYVQSCEEETLRVHIQDNELRLCSGDCFYVPPANEYWLENKSEDVECNVFFVLIKASGMDPDDLVSEYEDESGGEAEGDPK